MLSDASLARLMEIYLIANTPGYLYQHFLREDGVQRLARTHGAAELVSIIAEVDEKDERNPADVVRAYAATVALTYHKSGDVFVALEGLRIKHLEWVGSILKLWDQKRASSASYRVPPKPRVTATSSPSVNHRVL